jgi:hypothetical protein
MKHIPTLARLLLGLAFITSSVRTCLPNFIPMPAARRRLLHKLFMFAMFPSGYLTCREGARSSRRPSALLSGRFNNLALSCSVPIVVNILACITSSSSKAAH